MSNLVTLTGRVKRSIESILSRQDVSEVTKREFKQILEEEEQKKEDDPQVISFKSVRKLHQVMSNGDSPTIYLHELLEGTEIHHPPWKPPERNPELLARLERLKAEQDDRRYREMTRNVNIKTYGESPLSQIGREVRPVQAQMMGLVNIVLTIGGAFVFGYMAASYESQPVIVCVSCGLILGLIVACADLYFFIKTEV